MLVQELEPQLVGPPVAVRPPDAGDVGEGALARGLVNNLRVHVSLRSLGEPGTLSRQPDCGLCDLVYLFLRIEFSVAILTVIQRIILVSMIEKNDNHSIPQW
jgi:hypothetical protein